MSRPNLTISAEPSIAVDGAPSSPLTPNTPLSPGRKNESPWARAQRLKKDAEVFHERRRASSATEPPITLTSLATEIATTRIKEEEEEKVEVAQKREDDLAKLKKWEQKARPNISVSASPASPSNKGSGSSPLSPVSPKSPRSPMKVSSVETTEVPDDLKLIWAELRKPTTDQSWVLCGFTDNKSKKVTLLGNGKGGLKELKPKLNHKAVQFGAIRVTSVDEHARRPKFIAFTLVGSELSPSQRLQAIYVKDIHRDYLYGVHTSMEVQLADELDETSIAKKVISIEKGVLSVDFGDVVIQASSLTKK